MIMIEDVSMIANAAIVMIDMLDLVATGLNNNRAGVVIATACLAPMTMTVTRIMMTVM